MAKKLCLSAVVETDAENEAWEGKNSSRIPPGHQHLELPLIAKGSASAPGCWENNTIRDDKLGNIKAVRLSQVKTVTVQIWVYVSPPCP